MTTHAADTETKVHTKVYDAVNQPVFDLVPRTARRILDVGCGSGTLGREIKKLRECEIIGLTHSETEVALASENIDRVLVCDLDNFNAEGLGMFDCIICSHVLEHLQDPWGLLQTLRTHLESEGVLIVALPNVLNIKQRVEFLKGKFEYQEFGLMDRTHLRFFDWNTCYDLMRGAGLEVIVRTSTGFFPLPLIRKLLGTAVKPIDRLACKWMPQAFAFQFILVGRPAQA